MGQDSGPPEAPIAAESGVDHRAKGDHKTRALAKSAGVSRQRLQAIQGPMTRVKSARERRAQAMEHAMEGREMFVQFLDFPTPYLLSEGNRVYAATARRPKGGKDGSLPPYPCPTKRRELFDPARYKNVDGFAVSMKQDLYTKSLKDFTELLVERFKGNDLARVRVIFRWLANLNLDEIELSGVSGDQAKGDITVEGWLRRLKSNPSYCSIFHRMCGFAGIVSKFLRGYVKHGTYEIGETPTDTDTGEWVAVLVSGSWRLVDPTWGCSGVVGSDPGGTWKLLDNDGQSQIANQKVDHQKVYMMDEDYFLTDPERFICSHFPLSGGCWQLLARQVTLQEFTNMANLEPAFFDLGLRILGQRECVLHARDGDTAIQIGIPGDGKRTFAHKLWISNKKKVMDSQLDRFCLMSQKNNVLDCRISFPIAGTYKFELCAGDAYGDGYTSLVCTYIIHSDKANKRQDPFPENGRQEWGPGPDLEKAGLKPLTHKDALVEAENGTTQVRLKLKRPMQLRNELHSNTQTRAELQGRVLHSFDTNTSEVSVSVDLPKKEKYALNMYTAEVGSNTWSNVCSYIVSAARGAFDLGNAPPVTDGQVGSLTNKLVNLRLVSHDSSIIDCPNTGKLRLKFQCDASCDTFTKLDLLKQGSTVEKDNYVWTKYGNKTVRYTVHFPEAGHYTLTVLAKQVSAEEKAYVCLIKVPVPMAPCEPFPKTSDKWKLKCKLIEPRSGLLPADSCVDFAVQLPDASRVRISTDGNNRALEQDNDNIWRGRVETPAAGQQINLDAEIGGKSDYSTFLSFTTEDEQRLKKAAELQKERQEKTKTKHEELKRLQLVWETCREEEFARAETALIEAVKNMDVDAIKNAIETLEEKQFVSRLSKKIAEARMLLKYLELVPTIEQDKLLEVRNYTNPPIVLHEIITVTLLLLGEDETRTQDWDKCRKRLKSIGREGLNRLLATLDVVHLDAEIVSRAQEIVVKYQLDDVIKVNDVAGKLHSWVVNVLEQYSVFYPSKKFARPATAARQKQLLRETRRKEV